MSATRAVAVAGVALLASVANGQVKAPGGFSAAAGLSLRSSAQDSALLPDWTAEPAERLGGRGALLNDQKLSIFSGLSQSLSQGWAAFQY